MIESSALTDPCCSTTPQVSLPGKGESLTAVGIAPLSTAAVGFALADLVAKDVGSKQQLAPEREASLQQLLYSVQWQAAEATLAVGAPAQQPLLAAVLKAGRAVTVVGSSRSVTASETQLLQALQGSSANGLRSAKQWLLPAAAGLPARTGISIAPAIGRQSAGQAAAAAGLHGMLKAAATEQLLAGDAAVVYGSSRAPPGNNSGRQFGTAVHSAAAYAAVLLPTSGPGAAPATSGSPEAVPGLVLITGGLGGLGMLSAAWMQAQRAGQHLVLLGRSGRSASAPGDASMAALTGGWVSMVRSDVAVAEEAAAAVALASRQQTLQAVLHAGGVLADALLLNQTHAKLRAVASPKVEGLQRLAAAAAQQPLQQLVVYSSIAGELGTAGQGGYAAANSALDASAAALQLQGRSGSSVQWGAWAGAGMAAAEPTLLQKLLRQGYAAVQPAAGLAALRGLLHRSEVAAAVVMAAPFDWGRFLSSAARRQLPFFTAVQPKQQQQAQPNVQARAAQQPVQRPATIAVTAETVLPAVYQLLADLIGAAADSSSPDVPFLEAGLDSIGAVELRCGRAFQFNCVCYCSAHDAIGTPFLTPCSPS